jgi:methionyl-tRNA formyltransferase
VIVLAADDVGERVVRILLDRGQALTAVVLHTSDPRSHNESIRDLVRRQGSHDLLATEADLERPDFLDDLAAASPRFGILAWWPSIIKGRLLELPASGWLNLHPSFLPFNRGRHPNFWCLASDTPCGVSIHLADPGVDSGPIVVRRRVETTWEDTGGSVYVRSRDAIVQLFEEHIDRILDGGLELVAQDPMEGSFHRSPDMDDASEIDLDAPTTARALLNVIRARTFPPYPAARFREGGHTYAVRVEIEKVAE